MTPLPRDRIRRPGDPPGGVPATAQEISDVIHGRDRTPEPVWLRATHDRLFAVERGDAAYTRLVAEGATEVDGP